MLLPFFSLAFLYLSASETQWLSEMELGKQAALGLNCSPQGQNMAAWGRCDEQA